MGYSVIQCSLYSMNNIRNFAIIAHVDHGKSTLADRFLEITGVVVKGKHQEQMLDQNPISRERGITIKLAPVRMEYRYKLKVKSQKLKVNNNETLDFRLWILNLIDTPGHVDFSYEVERTLACVEGVILLVDATQGMQAQTIAHAYKAISLDKVILPCVNKIDMPGADVPNTKKELAEFLSVAVDEVYEISARTGQNVEKLLEAVIEKIHAPKKSKSKILNPKSPHMRYPTEAGHYQNSNFQNTKQNSLEYLSLTHSDLFDASDLGFRASGIRALIFDSYYDQYRGVIAFVRVFEGEIKKGVKVKLFATHTEFEVLEVGIFTPLLQKKERLVDGEIGYVVTNLKDIHLVRVGDTMADSTSDISPLPGYKAVKPMVYASLFPTDPDAYHDVKKSLEKLTLNDASLTYESIYSTALGSGLRVGFLGLLHADVVRERLEREFGVSLILTPPTVEYRMTSAHGKIQYEEPIACLTVVTPQKYTGVVMQLCEESRGTFITMDNKSHVYLSYEMPLSEFISYFYDRLKTITSGYASLDWEIIRYQPVDADKLILLLNSEPVEEFSEFVVTDRAYERGRMLTQRLHDLIPRQQYEIKIQAQYKGKIIASERIAPFRKDVTQKLYGGDRSRKDKLLDRQKKGKKMMKQIGRVEIPKEVFLKLFKQ